MTVHRPDYASMTLDEIADRMAGAQPGSQVDHVAKCEYLLRQTRSQLETSVATRASARYILLSVLVLALASVANLVVTLAQWSN